MKEKYLVMNQEPNVNILGVDRIILAFHNKQMKDFTGKNFSNFVYELEEGMMRACALKSETKAISQLFFDKIISDKTFEKEMIEKVENYADEIYKICKSTLRRLREKNISEEERKEIIKKIFFLFTDICVYGLIGPIIEIDCGGITKNLNDVVKSKVSSSSNEAINLLSFRLEESFDQKSEKSLARIAQKISDNNQWRKMFAEGEVSEEIKMEIEEHVFEWGWINYGYRGPEYTSNNALGGIKEILDLNILPKEYTKNISSELNDKINKKRELITNLKFNEEEKYIIKTAEDIVYGKYVRAKMMALMSFTINSLLKHFANKEGLSMKQVGVCTSREILNYFENGKFPDVNNLNERLKYCILISKPEGDEILIGEKAREWAKENIEVEEYDENLSEVNGQVASPGGVIKGTVKVVNLTSEMEKFNVRDILVSIATTPDIVPVMKKAAAIVTNMGGLTCHAAIVSRELGIPCVIGTKIATKVFKDGDLVEVDAEKGVVRKI